MWRIGDTHWHGVGDDVLGVLNTSKHQFENVHIQFPPSCLLPEHVGSFSIVVFVFSSFVLLVFFFNSITSSSLMRRTKMLADVVRLSDFSMDVVGEARRYMSIHLGCGE